MKYINTVLKLFSKSHLYVILSAVMLLLITSLMAEVLSPLLFVVVLFVSGCLIIKIIGGNSSQLIIRLFTFIFCVSIVITCLTYLYYMNIYGVPFESGGTDDLAFETVAMTLVNSSITSLEQAKEFIRLEGSGTWHAAGYYTMLVAGIHFLVISIGLEPHTLNPRLLNAFFMAMTSVVTYFVARRCMTETAAQFSGYYVGLLPTVVFCSAHVYRDILVGFSIISVLAMTLVVLDRLHDLTSCKHIFSLSISIVFLMFFILLAVSLREGFSIIIPSIVGMTILVQIRSRRIQLYLLCLALLISLWLLGEGMFAKYIDSAALFTEYYSEYRTNLSSEAGVATAIYQLPFLISIPFRVVYASINPVPFPTELITENYRRLGSIIWYFSIPFLVSGIWLCVKSVGNTRSINLRSVVVTFMSTYLLVALITMQSRHITLFAPAGAILVASGVENCSNRVAKNLRFMLLMACVAVVMYVLYKLI